MKFLLIVGGEVEPHRLVPRLSLGARNSRLSLALTADARSEPYKRRVDDII